MVGYWSLETTGAAESEENVFECYCLVVLVCSKGTVVQFSGVNGLLLQCDLLCHDLYK